MQTVPSIPVVDIFAGPGGLGEGFSAYGQQGTGIHRPFRIAVSAEKEAWAWRTLRLRAFFRQFAPDEVPSSYYDYIRGEGHFPYTDATLRQWKIAGEEARQLKLGDPDDDLVLDSLVRQVAGLDRPWVLIGGPPCQAYSLAGRVRNLGVPGYVAEKDRRHFLYEHYLQLVAKYRPAVFVMENVKGMLSASIRGERLFQRILEDLHHPGRTGPRYRILPLVARATPSLFADPRPADYIVRSELFGVPQARHRVILLGVREDIPIDGMPGMVPSGSSVTVRDVIGSLPRLRSGTTTPGTDHWPSRADRIYRRAARKVGGHDPEVAARLNALASQTADWPDPGRGSQWVPGPGGAASLGSWYHDSRLGGVTNHETRSHMDQDLERYAYAAVFASLRKSSPTSADFPPALAPSHANWKSGKFKDRFTVQRFDAPSSTITSHLSKDGHYFIHPDARQIRSLTVREAARLQTFPDNYFFEGARGSQFQQVGNAVPPWLACQIAEVVYRIIRGAGRRPDPHAIRLEGVQLQETVV